MNWLEDTTVQSEEDTFSLFGGHRPCNIGRTFQDTDRGLVILGIRFQDTGRGLAILEECFHKETALTLESSRKSWTIQYQWDTIGIGLAILGVRFQDTG